MRCADLEWHIARNLADREESPVRNTESEANGCRQQLMDRILRPYATPNILKVYAAIFNPRSSTCPHRWNDCGSVSEYSRPRAARGPMGIHALLAGRTP